MQDKHAFPKEKKQDMVDRRRRGGRANRGFLRYPPLLCERSTGNSQMSSGVKHRMISKYRAQFAREVEEA